MALVHECRHFKMKANVMFVATTRRISSSTAAYFIIVTAALCACAVPAISQCVRPPAENAYNYSKVNETNLRANGFKVTGIQCANGYEMRRGLINGGHTSPIVSCNANAAANGDPYLVSGCVKTPNSSWTCASLNVTDLDNDAYDVSNAVETNLAADALNVTGVICSKGYKGTAKVSPCSWQVGTKTVCETKQVYERGRYGWPNCRLPVQNGLRSQSQKLLSKQQQWPNCRLPVQHALRSQSQKLVPKQQQGSNCRLPVQ